MSPQEIQTLQQFLTQLVQVRGIAKDTQADAMISGAVAQQPDAAYLLVQRALLMEQALNHANGQIAALQNQLQATQQAPARGFLDAETWGSPAAQRQQPMQQPMMAPQAMYPAQAPGFFGGRVGSMLGNVAATAAGVAGGAFLFQGIEHLLNPGGGGFLGSGGGYAPPFESTTVNNYYNDAPDYSANTDLPPDDGNWGDDASLS
jgi:hypothetical protein